jgi:opacity protein-like surface antigen
VGYYFTPNFGLGGTVAFLNNAVNLPALRDDLIAEIEERYPDIEIPEDAQISFNVGAWNHVNFLVGPQFSLPFGGVAIDLRALAGMSWVFPPPAELYIADESQGLDYRLYWDQKQSVAFAYDFGGGLRFNTRNNYIIRIGIDYSYTKAKFNINDEITLPGETPDNSTREVTQELGTIQAMIGLGYYF